MKVCYQILTLTTPLFQPPAPQLVITPSNLIFGAPSLSKVEVAWAAGAA